MIVDSCEQPKARFLFAHGAGAPMDSDFMQQVAEGLAALGIEVVRFNFDYMQLRAQDGKKRPPDRMPKLQQCFHTQIAQLPQDGLPLFIGGKSMGGRVSSLIVEQTDAQAAIVFGFPFHAPGKPVKDRIEHLAALDKPMLVLQGTRDTMGTQEEVSHYQLSKHIQLFWLEDGDHSLKPRKASGFDYQQHLEKAIQHAANFMLSRA